ncbi:MAG: (2Fe-2S)-binding protein [Alphaproteobacteria bacterium]
MFVCICNAVNHTTIANAINEGHSTADSVYSACGVQPKCRKCSVFIEGMIEETHGPINQDAAAELPQYGAD